MFARLYIRNKLGGSVMNKNIKNNMVHAGPKAGKGALGFIFSVVLLDVIGLAILMPVQAYIVRQYSDEAIMVAMIPMLYAGAQFFAAPLLGKLSDRYGRRPVLLISILGSAFGYFLFGVGGALWVLFLSRLLDGFTAGNASTASAYIADVTPPQDRAKNYGFIGMAWGLGFILGPALDGLLSEISLNAPAYAAGILSLLSAVVGYFILPESLPKEKRESKPLRLADLNPFASVFELLRPLKSAGRSDVGTILHSI
jgi:MFS transporter, DHA1 family, tetracycline resistance protein